MKEEKKELAKGIREVKMEGRGKEKESQGGRKQSEWVSA